MNLGFPNMNLRVILIFELLLCNALSLAFCYLYAVRNGRHRDTTGSSIYGWYMMPTICLIKMLKSFIQYFSQVSAKRFILWRLISNKTYTPISVSVYAASDVSFVIRAGCSRIMSKFVPIIGLASSTDPFSIHISACFNIEVKPKGSSVLATSLGNL
jgi:hypothetical protein